MIYYQADFLRQYPDIEDESVTLCLSSVPKDILDKRLGTLFGLLDLCMSRAGVILIDLPADRELERRTTKLFGMGHPHGWFLQGYYLIKNHYHRGEDQYICPFIHRYGQYYDGHVFSPGKFPREISVIRKREKAHPCEFCPDLIAQLIEAHSNPGDAVLDPFCGTGTVPGEADKLGRVGIGCDVRPESNIREEYR